MTWITWRSAQSISYEYALRLLGMRGLELGEALVEVETHPEYWTGTTPTLFVAAAKLALRWGHIAKVREEAAGRSAPRFNALFENPPQEEYITDSVPSSSPPFSPQEGQQ